MRTLTWTIAWRSLARNKVFSTIGIAGLGLGMTCSLLILLWVKDELSYDGRQPANLARVMTHFLDKDGSIGGSGSYTQGLLSDALVRQVPEVAYAATVVWEDQMIFSANGKTQREGGRYVGNDFFKMFDFPLIEGHFGVTPDDIVLTESLARKYFRGRDPIGQTVRIDNKRDYIVSGVAADVPEQSSIGFGYVIPIQHCFEDNPWMVSGWDHLGPDTYVLLKPGADMQKVSAKLKNFITAQDPQVRDKQLSLQPYRDIYLHSTFVRGLPDGGRIDYVRLFTLVAVFILLIACINFVNLATARAAKRAKEVGVRKAVGARRSSLVRQFLAEALVFSCCAMLLSAALVGLLLPWFNALTGKHIVLKADAWLAALPAVALATGLLAGIYPALFLSSLKPVSVLKGKLRFGPRSAYLRKGLVWLQFALSILLIVCTIVVSKQLRYVEHTNAGVDRSNLLYVPVDDKLGAHFDAFRHDLGESGDFDGITLISSIPTFVGWYSDDISWQGRTAGEKKGLAELDVTYGSMEMLRLPMAEGRVFSAQFVTDSNNFILNETAVRTLGLKDPVGKSFSHQQTKGRIIGVVRDFHMASLHDPIAPLFIQLRPSMRTGAGVIRIRSSAALQVLANTWSTYDPGVPLDYMFAEDEFRSHYQSEATIEQLSRVFSLVAILISCLGLFGLAIFTAEQRTREIGVRKVLGAKTADLFALLSKDFLQPVGLAALCAFPVAGWLMHLWLQGYAYRTSLSWWVFGLSGGLALGIALITVSYQSLKAARTRPAVSLRED